MMMKGQRDPCLWEYSDQRSESGVKVTEDCYGQVWRKPSAAGLHIYLTWAIIPTLLVCFLIEPHDFNSFWLETGVVLYLTF